MPKRQTSASHGSDGNDYEVGYGKPPTHSRFRPGQSGNPAGRRRGLRNLKSDVKRALSAPVKITEGGRKRTRSTQQGILMVLREKALHGDARALDLALKLAGEYNSDAPEGAPTSALTADDQAILDAYVAGRTSSPVAPTESSDDPASKTNSDSNEKAPK